MPFTLSHTAAAALFSHCFRRGKLSITGVAIGSMAPDFEYFLRMKMYGEIGHSPLGVLLLDLPLAIIMALLFHLYIRAPLIQHLPTYLNRRLCVYQQLEWVHYFKKHTLIVIFSVLLGVITHLIWDAATHPTGFWVQHFALLQKTIALGDHKIAIFKLLQHMSSVLGLAFLLGILLHLPTYNHNIGRPSFKSFMLYWGGIALVFVLMLCTWIGFNPELLGKIGHMIVASMACAFWSMFIISITYHLKLA